jgi:hypothetical protein
VSLIPNDEKNPLPEKTLQAIAEPAVTPTPVHTGPRVLFYMAHSEGDAQKLAQTLEKSPSLKTTIIFPPKYFSQEEPSPALPRFKVLQSSGQIEIALTLENQPNLPLLYELSLGGKQALAWKIGFSWPDDVGGQIALGSGLHQKRWSVLPSGFYPPYLILSPNVANVIKQFRFDWVLGKPGSTSGATYVGSVAYISPVKIEAESPSEAVQGVLANRLSFVDSAMWDNPTQETEFLEMLATKISTQSADGFITAREWVSTIENTDFLADPSQVYERDYSKWFVSERQRMAWIALANARDVIETYQNSGRANLKRLDAALEEMYSAENGDFLLSLGQDKFISVVAERSFLATVGNVYRLCGVQVPANLNTWFSNVRIRKTDVVNSGAGVAGPFYVDGPDRMTWNDLNGDEGNADHKLIYPVGKYAPGSFDLKTLLVRWDDSDVTFEITFGGSPDLEKQVVLPVTDIYIDVNGLSGAGSQDVLPGRRGGAIGRDAAWEYAISMTPIHSVLFQPVPGGAPRVLQRMGVSMQGPLVVTFPRSILRGNPKQWRLTVGVSGTDIRKWEDSTSVQVLPSASDHGFGGSAGRTGASFVDLLSDSDKDQNPLMGVSGTDRFSLPWVKAD